MTAGASARYRHAMDEIGLDLVDPQHPPLEAVERLRKRVPFDVELRASEVVVTGGDFETMRRHLSAALADPVLRAHFRRGW